ncbi:MAG: hypothetical protein HY901_27490, partial [Deltaproteobacteria bacterium]|nr:hypothetical protein [Deltaproteobacteria bacterium]
EEVRRRRSEVQGLVAEVEAILPRVKELVAAKTLGSEIVIKVEKALKIARVAVEGRELAPVLAAAEDLTKTVAALKGVVARLGKGG